MTDQFAPIDKPYMKFWQARFDDMGLAKIFKAVKSVKVKAVKKRKGKRKVRK